MPKRGPGISWIYLIKDRKRDDKISGARIMSQKMSCLRSGRAPVFTAVSLGLHRVSGTYDTQQILAGGWDSLEGRREFRGDHYASNMTSVSFCVLLYDLVLSPWLWQRLEYLIYKT